ncbi:MAG: permease-like cell division protein FtsX [Candidatus Nanopelagicales bacterium]|nr:permease-like cell division protein FtsX [Candidatus Nanopelagicales bacterium]MDZ4249938.1 permease-like cell division protein FtsX [Candidatus Nanopelagicales bacterium]
MGFRFVMGEVWTGLRRNLTMTIALIVTIGVSLALFGAGVLVRQQVGQMKGFWFDKVEVSVFMCTKNSQEPSCTGAVTTAQRDQIKADLEALSPLVSEIYYETSQEAYDRFKEQFKGSPIVDDATPDDLGESYRVKLTDPDRYAVITKAFTGRPGVERVDDQKQVLDKLFRLLDGLQAISLGIAAAMLLVTVLLVGNTMRLAAFSRRRETGIMRLVGASKFYIQLPFVLESVIAAAVGAFLAIGAMAGVKLLLVDRFLEPEFRFTPFVGWETVWQTALLMLVLGVGLSAVSAVFTLRRWLRV